MDINEAIDNEIPNAMEIQIAVEERNKIKKWKKELEERRKVLDAQISDWMKTNSLKEIAVDNIAVTVVKSKGSGRWDKQELISILNPMQLEKVYSEGKPYSYLKIIEKAND